MRLPLAILIALTLTASASAGDRYWGPNPNNCHRGHGNVLVCEYPRSTFNHGYDAAYLGRTGSGSGVLMLPRKSEVGSEKYGCLYRHELRHANERGSQDHHGSWERC